MNAKAKNRQQLQTYAERVQHYLVKLFRAYPDEILPYMDGRVVVFFKHYDPNLAGLLYLHHQLHSHEVLIHEFPNSDGGNGMLVHIYLKENMPPVLRLIHSIPVIRDIVRAL